MRAGRLDRRVTLQRRTVTRGSTGQEVETWADERRIWMSKRDVKASERFTGDQLVAEVDTVFTARALAAREVSPETHRLVYDGRIFELKGLREIGRRGWLELFALRRGEVPPPPAPDAPAITTASPYVTNDPLAPIDGTAAPGSRITIYANDIVAGVVSADSGGAWSFTFAAAFAEGEYEITAHATGPGGRSPFSVPLTLQVDLTPPAAPVITTPSPLITNNNMPPIAGTAEPLAAVQLHLDGAASGQPVAADETGNWSKTFGAIAAGSYEVTATARDAAGNISAPSAPLALTIDLTPPEAPVITVPTSPFVTTNREPEFEGTAEALAAVTIYLDGEEYMVTAADENGDWAFAFDELDIGTYEVTATATDQAGNESAPSAALTLTVNEPLAIEGSPVTLAVQGEAYGFTVSVPAGRGVPPFTFRLAGSSGVVPAGFSVDADTGEVSGPLTQPGIFPAIIIEVEDSE